MEYHPIIGISIFIISLMISFIIGIRYKKNKLSNIKSSKIISISKLSHKKKIISDNISPDAHWLDK